ncbi:MAG: hypothetical protein HYZ28_16440, partial [Myxococcales bacterium]|nr:hypothetical protein [Myxococcales bacterium]
GVPDDFETILGSSPTNADSDADGLGDGAEVGLGTDLLSGDSDGDGAGDAAEVGSGPKPLDTDGDGLIDALEPGGENNQKATSSEDLLWLVEVQGVMRRTDTTSPALCFGDGTAAEVQVLSYRAPTLFVESFGATAAAVAPFSAAVVDGTVSTVQLYCPLNGGSFSVTQRIAPEATCTRTRSCSPGGSPASLYHYNSVLAPAGFFQGAFQPEKNGGPDSMTWKHEIVQVVKGVVTKAPTTSFLPAFEYRLPIEQLMQGRKFAHHGAITVPGSLTQFFFAATAIPPRPIIDDIDLSYVPEVGTYPPASAAKDIQVKLEPAVRDGVPVKAKFQIRLSDTTKYPGCAMNAHNGVAPCPISALDNDPDVRFEDAASLPPNCTKSTVGTEQLLTCSDFKTTLSFKLVVEDFGAYTKLRAEALDIEVGSKSFPKSSNPIEGLVQGRPETEHHTTLPIDRGVGGAVANNKIADVGWDAFVGGGNPPVKVNDSGLPGADGDPIPPGDGTPGDGFIRLEEYRGFVAFSTHRRSNPSQKDLFLIAEGQYGVGFAAALPLVVHRIRLIEASQFRRVNYLGTGHPAQYLQGAVEVVESPGTCGSPAVLGMGSGSLPAGDAPTTDVFLNPIRYKTAPTLGNCATEDPADADVIRSVIGHEVGGVIGMQEYPSGSHGGTDSIMGEMGQPGNTVLVGGVTESFFEKPPKFYDPTDEGYLRLVP